MAKLSGKNYWVLLLLMLCGIVVGSFVGYITKDISAVSWLNYGYEFGIGSNDGVNAFVLNLGVIVITFGLTIKITVASVIGMMIAILSYCKL